MVQATVGRGRNMPAYFHARVKKGTTQCNLSDELHELGYCAGDSVELELLEGRTGFAIRPTNRPREQTVLDMEPDPRACPPLKELRRFSWQARELAELVASYDAGTWRGHDNLELDRKAYHLFSGGVRVDSGRLVDMLAHVGEFYGGAYRPDGDVRTQAKRIAAAVEANARKQQELVARQKPLLEAVPSVDDVVALMEPFKQEKMWFVWGAKFLHFLRPDTFPIIDRRIEAALGHRQRLCNSPGYLVEFCRLVQKVATENRIALEDVRRPDLLHAEPSILKVLDKALWVLGGRDRS